MAVVVALPVVYLYCRGHSKTEKNYPIDFFSFTKKASKIYIYCNDDYCTNPVRRGASLIVSSVRMWFVTFGIKETTRLLLRKGHREVLGNSETFYPSS